MDKIILKNMKFYGYHGVLEVERELGQHFEVDVEMFSDLSPAAKNDDTNQTIDYGLVYTTVENVVTGKKFKLLETMAEKIANTILEKYKPEKVLVRIRKTSIPINGTMDYAGVEIIRPQE